MYDKFVAIVNDTGGLFGSITAESLAERYLSPDAPVSPVEPVGPVEPVEPVGPSMPSKFTLYTTDEPYEPSILVVEPITN